LSKRFFGTSFCQRGSWEKLGPPFGQRRPEKSKKARVFEPQAEGAHFVSNTTFTLDYSFFIKDLGLKF